MASKFEQVYKSLSMKELRIIEEKSGMGIGTLGSEEAPKAALLTAMAWVVKKREQADFSYEDAENLNQETVNTILGMDGEDEGNESPEG